ncbi:MAG TPA: riboflavin synthase [Bryobacteraceae bacterium]|jgi:riboflavin synthase|nr:riboflavin synthase [Bryobacteraceae bacterium]
MFTGIVEELGRVSSLDMQASGARLKVACRAVLEQSMPGSSIAVNGVCLTAVMLENGAFAADLSPETLSRSNLGRLAEGSLVNLERPLSFTGRVGGHLVQGHVDGTGEMLSLDALGDGNWWLQVRIPDDLARYVIPKGSITLDGISLTVAALEGNTVSVAVIPHTYANTALKERKPGWPVNVEVDLMAKYAERLLGAHLPQAARLMD